VWEAGAPEKCKDNEAQLRGVSCNAFNKQTEWQNADVVG